jgi:hypothetical protein
MATFVRMAGNLERFNSHAIPRWMQRDRDAEFRTKRLVQPPPPNSKKPVPLPKDNWLWKTPLFQGLRRISDLRCEAADANAWFGERSTSILRWLFVFTLMAAVMLHIFAHGHPREPVSNAAHGATAQTHETNMTPTPAVNGERVDGHGKPTGDSTDAVAGDIESGQESPHKSVIRYFAGLAACIFVVAGLTIFVFGRALHFGEQRDDARALGEGLRVQFYWNLAGLGESVSANYMQRQRSELDWIRAAVRAISIPYVWWADRFAGLLPEQKLDVMRCVHGGWIQEQQNYFKGAYHKHLHALHGWHNLGFVAALAGLLLMTACWIIDWIEPPRFWLNADRGTLVRWGLILIGIAAVWRLVLWGVNLLIRALNGTDEESAPSNEHTREPAGKGKSWFTILHDFILPRRPQGGRVEHGQHYEPWYWYVRRCLRHWRALLLTGLKNLADHLTPAWNSEHPPLARFVPVFVRSVYDFLALLPISLAVALLTMSAAHCVGHSFNTGPNEENLRIIAGGILLLFGAMSIAWVEKNFDSELSYQYNNMAGLFQHANHRMTQLLSELEQAHAKLESTVAGSPEREEAQAGFDRALADTQAFLFEVGVEALDENAEWLILHRSRPMEPVMAG